jgi:hypothetical protein
MDDVLADLLWPTLLILDSSRTSPVCFFELVARSEATVVQRRARVGVAART